MNLFARAFTVRSVVAWPTLIVAVSWAIVANLGDSAYNGMKFPIQRALLVAGLVCMQFGLTWLIDRMLLLRLNDRARAIGLLAAFCVAGWLRGAGVALMMFVIGATPDLMLSGRMIAATIQTLEIALFAFAYGALLTNARQLRELRGVRERLGQLAEQASAVRAADDVALVSQVRSQLRNRLNWADDATPHDILDTLNRAIDELVRPLSRALSVPVAIPEPPEQGNARVDWRSVWRDACDSDQLRLGWAFAVLLLVIAVPTVSLFGAWGPALALAIVCVMWLAMAATRIAARADPSVRRIASPLVLLVGSLVVMVAFWLVFPHEVRVSYVIITPFTVSLATLVPSIMAIALARSADLTRLLEQENERLRWSIARTNEITRQRRETVATALHGSVQAALAAAHLRLQLALRDGFDSVLALAQARADAERAVILAVDLSQPVTGTVARLAELQSGWAGVTDLSVDVAADVLDADPVAARLVTDLFTEAVLNAVKHAEADWVECSVKGVGDTLTLSVRNPGTGVAVATTPGGGTRLLERSTISWELTHTDGVTTLSARLPFSPAEG